MDLPLRDRGPFLNPDREYFINERGHRPDSHNPIFNTVPSTNGIQLATHSSRPQLGPGQTSLSDLRDGEEDHRNAESMGPVYIRGDFKLASSSKLTKPFYHSYDVGRGEGKVFKMGGGESYRPAGDLPRSPVGRADTFRISGRDRDRSPRRERVRDRARTPIRDRARTPIRDRARTPIRERARTPPPTDRYLPLGRDRSPDRRSRSPSAFRRRERSPPPRDPREIPTWRARDRARSPPPARRMSPRRESPRRGSPRRDSLRGGSPPRGSPRRDEYRRAPSPKRDLIRDRDTRARSRSPYDRDRGAVRARSPLPSRRSPPPVIQRGWRRSPPDRRNERVFTGPTSLTWRRPRSPSPPPRDSLQTSGMDSGKDSGSTSRRSSPPIHPSRAVYQTSRAASPVNRDRSPSARPASYRDEDVDMAAPQDGSPARAYPNQDSPVRRSPPRGPSAHRAPPSGPSSGYRNFTAPPASVPTHNRSETNGALAAPAGPRSFHHPFRGRGGRGAFRGENTWHNPALSRPKASVSPTLSTVAPTVSPGIPTGPRATSSHIIVTERSKTWVAPALRAAVASSPSSSSFARLTTSRSFDNASTAASAAGGPNSGVPSKPHVRNHPYLSSLPVIVSGGRKDPAASGIPRDLEARLRKNEEEAERLREDLRVKEEKVRLGLRGWERLERESSAARIRSDLSEQQVRVLAGEGIGGAF